MRSEMLSILLLALAACRGGEGNGSAPAPARSALADGPLTHSVLPRQNLPPLTSLGRNGMRVSIAPFDSDYAFLVDFTPLPHDCHVAVERDADQARLAREGCREVEVRYGRIGQHGLEGEMRFDRFIVPVNDYRDAIRRLELMARTWSDPQGYLDGTVIGVELYREGRLRSIASNEPGPDSPTAALGVAVHRLLLAYGPTGAVPRSSSFMITPIEPDFPCMGTDFVRPDPDGFGTGDDACAHGRATRTGPTANSADEEAR